MLSVNVVSILRSASRFRSPRAVICDFDVHETEAWFYGWQTGGAGDDRAASHLTNTVIKAQITVSHTLFIRDNTAQLT